MARRKTYHSSITGKFVSKEYVEKYPDTTVEVTTCNLRQELIDFFIYFWAYGDNHTSKTFEEFVDHYLEENK